MKKLLVGIVLLSLLGINNADARGKYCYIEDGTNVSVNGSRYKGKFKCNVTVTDTHITIVSITIITERGKEYILPWHRVYNMTIIK